MFRWSDFRIAQFNYWQLRKVKIFRTKYKDKYQIPVK